MKTTALKEITLSSEKKSDINLAVPTSIKQSGLDENFLIKLTSKHLYEHGVVEISSLNKLLALSGKVVQQIVDLMKSQALVETHGSTNESRSLRFGLTDKGRKVALESLTSSGYIGPAPIPVSQYIELVKQQSVHQNIITKEKMSEAFKDVQIKQRVLDQLGPAMHSGRAIFLYGHSGSGKTYTCLKLSQLITGNIYIPYSIAIGEAVLQLFDPQIHVKVDQKIQSDSMKLANRHDPRFVLCKRPVIVVGSELTLEDLEVRYDKNLRQFHAPSQLKANNGLLLIDDLGRAHVSTEKLLNRWIIPMEEKKDYYYIGYGARISIPFDLILLFSTNLSPADLADDAFLRRIGHKVNFTDLDADEYRTIWQQTCTQLGINYKSQVVDYVIDNLYPNHTQPMLPCHPRDLINMAVDKCLYDQAKHDINVEHIKWAWNNYFVNEEQP